MASTIQHPCHRYPLQLMGTTETDGTAASCRACGLPFTSGSQLFGCRCCNVFLHRSSDSPSLERHPAHPGASLYLRCSNDTFVCYICGKCGGSGFNYHSRTCNCVAHFMCPHLPRTARGGGHQHPLSLVFEPPAREKTSCGVCGGQISHCYYKCSSCTDFNVHPWCLRTRPPSAWGPPARTDSIAKPPTGKLSWGIRAVVARKCAMHLLFAPYGDIDKRVDQLLVGGQDVADFHDYCSGVISDHNDFSNLDIVTFENLPDCFGKHLQEEAVSLLWAHMERMAADETASSSRCP